MPLSLLKFQITDKIKMKPPEKPGKEIRIDFKGRLHSNHFESHLFILLVVDKNSCCPVANISENTNHETVTTFLPDFTMNHFYRNMDNAKKKRMDLRLRTKEERRETHLGGGYSKVFVNPFREIQNIRRKLLETNKKANIQFPSNTKNKNELKSQ